MSLFEPINVLMSHADPDLFSGYDVTPVRTLAAKVQALYESIQPLGEDPTVDFDERDLVRHAQDAGFAEIDGTTSSRSRWKPVTNSSRPSSPKPWVELISM